MTPISGHVDRHEGARGPVWRAKYRLPDGRQVHRTIVPDQAHAGTLPGMVRTGVTFAGVCAEFLRYVEHDLDREPSTVGDYRSAIRAHLVPAFGSLRLEDVTADRIEAWKATLGGAVTPASSRRQRARLGPELLAVGERGRALSGGRAPGPAGDS